MLATSQAVPDILDNFDWDEAARKRAQWQGIPTDIMKSRERVEQIRAARAEAMQQAQEQQDQVMDAETIQKVGSVV